MYTLLTVYIQNKPNWPFLVKCSNLLHASAPHIPHSSIYSFYFASSRPIQSRKLGGSCRVECEANSYRVCTTLQCCAIQCCAVHYDKVECNTVQCNIVQCDTVLCTGVSAIGHCWEVPTAAARGAVKPRANYHNFFRSRWDTNPQNKRAL
jgi:hypothetical protein